MVIDFMKKKMIHLLMCFKQNHFTFGLICSSCVVACDGTSDGLLVVLHGAPPLHLHHTPLDATVADVTEVLRVPLHALRHGVRGCGSETALAFLKVFMVFHLRR